MFLPKCTGYSQCVYQNGPVINSMQINAPVIVSAFTCFYQNALVIISLLEALCDLYRVLSLRYLKLYCYMGISTKWQIDVRTKNSLPPNIFGTPYFVSNSNPAYVAKVHVLLTVVRTTVCSIHLYLEHSNHEVLFLCHPRPPPYFLF